VRRGQPGGAELIDQTRFSRPILADPSDHPYALLAAGRWREAATAWRDAGCPYEYAAALADSHDPADLLAALAELDALGAEPLARRVRARLREAGVKRWPAPPNWGSYPARSR
jgi:hypothetical protein